MMSRKFLPVVALCAATLLSGCSTVDYVRNIFDSGSTKPKVQGERISIIAPDQQLTADPALAMMQMVLPPPTRNMDWAQPGGSPDNVVGNLQADGSLQELWRADAGKGTDNDSVLTARPIVAGGMVYVLDAEAHVFAFNALSGAAAWDASLVPADIDVKGGFFDFFSSGTDATKGFGGGLAYGDGKLFATTGFGQVKALDAKTGKELWNANTIVPVRSAPVVADGRVYAITQENQLVTLDENDGHTLWDHRGIEESAGILSSASVAVSGDVVVVPYSSGELFALRNLNGGVAWTDSLSRTGNVTALTIINDIAGRPVVDRNLVFAVSQSGTMVAINFRTGSRAWTRNIPSIQTPLVVGDYLFVVSTEGQVVCMNREDGRVRWATQLDSYEDAVGKRRPIVWAGPLMVSNILMLVSNNGRAELMSPYTGQKIGETTIPAGTYIPPVIANGIMYVLTNEGELVALR